MKYDQKSDFERAAKILLRRLGLDFVPWEDEAPEKFDDAKDVVMKALGKVYNQGWHDALSIHRVDIKHDGR